MKRNFEFGPAREHEIDGIIRLWSESFGGADDLAQHHMQQCGLSQVRVMRRGNEVLAALSLLPMGQWFGGRIVPTHGIASVSTQPHMRGEGIAHVLLVETLRELKAQDGALVTLFPSSRHVYRKSGFELGGHSFRLTLSLGSSSKISATLPASQLRGIDDLAVLERVHRERARRGQGALERNAQLWNRLLSPARGKPSYAYVLGSVDQPEGYLLYTHQASAQSDRPDLLVRDWAVLTPAAGARLLRFFLQSSSVIRDVILPASPLDPWLLTLPELSHSTTSQHEWFVRLINLGKAFGERGYPPGSDCEIHLNVDDPLISENAGTHILRIKQGRGELVRGGRGDVSVSQRALGPLFTGLYRPHELQALGWLNGPAPALAALDAALTGPAPMMSDMF